MSLFEELKQRNVLRVGAAYVVTAWLVIQVVETIFPAFGFGDAAIRVVTIGFAIGLVPVLIFAWVFELTSEGLKRDSEIDRSQSLTPRNGRELDRIIMVVLVLALGYFAIDKFILDPARDAEQIQQARGQGRTEALVESYGEKSIAVLPFINMSSDPEQEYFSDGISEELLNLLAKIDELRVISRSSAFSYKGKDIDIPIVGKELNVAHILEGSVRKSGNKIRITAQLIDASTDTHLWSETFDRTLDDIFVIQDEIAAAIVAQLKIKLLGSVPTSKKVNPQAYALYLKARRILDDHSDDEVFMIEAESLIYRALELEPDYINALSELVRVYMRGGGSSRVNKDEGERLAREMVAKIQAVDPDEGSADAWLAWFAFYYDFDLVTGAFHLQRVLMANPTDAEYLRDSMQMLSTLGYLDEVVAIGEHVVANDPLCTVCQYRLARAYRLVGKLDEAEASILAALILVEPGRYPLQRDLGRVLALKGEPQAALEAFEEAKSLEGIAIAFHDLGRKEEFESTFRDIHKAYESEHPGSIAYVYAWIGEANAAFEYLDKQFEQSQARLSRIVRYPAFKSLHDDPRWTELLQKLGMSPEQLTGIDFRLPPLPGVVQQPQ